LKRANVELVVTPNTVLQILSFLKRSSGFKTNILIDIAAIDFAKQRKARFYLCYTLLNNRSGLRVNVYTGIVSQSRKLSSITGVFINANWAEREAFDMFGICFIGHPRLTRILSDYSMIGHPMQKTFPLTGRVSGRSKTSKGRVMWVLRGQIISDSDTD